MDKSKAREKFKRRKLALLKHQRQSFGKLTGKKIRVSADSYVEKRNASEQVRKYITGSKY